MNRLPGGRIARHLERRRQPVGRREGDRARVRIGVRVCRQRRRLLPAAPFMKWCSQRFVAQAVYLRARHFATIIEMNITRYASQPSTAGSSEYFTGSVRIESSFQRSASPAFSRPNLSDQPPRLARILCPHGKAIARRPIERRLIAICNHRLSQYSIKALQQGRAVCLQLVQAPGLAPYHLQRFIDEVRQRRG